ncbi:ABC transporter ATP-binding protein [Nonlabens arenilitoris]|uniref:ABC transporter ATP-binding protein n=1 Tax=Nonlabens arenilitoris TaxID=1217969 RepID=A0A2S7UCQ2_9FLAO|nr:ABC transporter ATP-binding protein [Nonlabens arenilitoris]PQJ32174.1 ABC transporter ATP-binding protein [Nonlabens arenilitoris]
MSDNIILKASNVSKQYRLGLVGTGTLTHDLNRFWHKIRGKEDPYLQIGAVNDRSASASSDYVWALQDINFEVKRGEILGIIGKNGAGKSTLLKILSRVTSPTTGSIKTKGRIASLLEVGTGMHPELTGRENIYLNGAILGMNKTEISSKIDEIIEFSGCQMYIDTPVKRYSSGMRVRLGFAVAAFLEPDILVVDEVLAVGDAEFQKKAIGKMQDISSTSGRTVLFVSHNMAAVQNLCPRTILMHNGRIEKDGFTSEIINYYLQIFRDEKLQQDLVFREDRKGKQELVFESYWFENENGKKLKLLQSGLNFYFVVKINNVVPKSFQNIKISIGIDNSKGNRLSLLDNFLTNQKINFEANECKEIRIHISNLPLQSGYYYFTLFVKDNENIQDWIENAGTFEVENGDFFKTGQLIEGNQGDLLIKHDFIGYEKN